MEIREMLQKSRDAWTQGAELKAVIFVGCRGSQAAIYPGQVSSGA